jgi:hypothetical protein
MTEESMHDRLRVTWPIVLDYREEQIEAFDRTRH